MLARGDAKALQKPNANTLQTDPPSWGISDHQGRLRSSCHAGGMLLTILNGQRGQVSWLTTHRTLIARI